MTTLELTAREGAVLAAVIDSYVRTAAPAGSLGDFAHSDDVEAHVTEQLGNEGARAEPAHVDQSVAVEEHGYTIDLERVVDNSYWASRAGPPKPVLVNGNIEGSAPRA